jgi:predicted small metal-binding protein
VLLARGTLCAGRSTVKEVTCLCGWRCRGTDDEVVAQVQAHGVEVHGIAATREEIMALAVDVAEDAPRADAPSA